jgi:Concanavalin A-like lectin/glucanases superfamily
VITKPLRVSRINWGNPLAEGLVFCAPFNEIAGAPIDLVSGAASVISGSPVWGATGLVYPLDAMHTWANVSDSHFLGSFTVISRFSISNIIGYKDIFNKCLTGGATNNLIDLYANGTSVALVRANTLPRTFTCTGVLAVDTPRTIAVVVSSDQIESTPVMYRDGRLLAGSGSGGTGTVTGSSQAVNIGNRSNLSLDMVGTIEYTMLWNRALTAAEVAAVSVNPWQLLAQSSTRSILAKLSQFMLWDAGLTFNAVAGWSDTARAQFSAGAGFPAASGFSDMSNAQMTALAALAAVSALTPATVAQLKAALNLSALAALQQEYPGAVAYLLRMLISGGTPSINATGAAPSMSATGGKPTITFSGV